MDSPANPASLLLACSGPYARVAAVENILISRMSAALCLVVTLVLLRESLRTRRYGWDMVAVVALLLAHPVWTVPLMTDCGTVKMVASVLFAILFTALRLRYHALSRRLSDQSPGNRHRALSGAGGRG